MSTSEPLTPELIRKASELRPRAPQAPVWLLRLTWRRIKSSDGVLRARPRRGMGWARWLWQLYFRAWCQVDYWWNPGERLG